MNTINKNELIDRISAKLKTQQKEKFVVGGNKHTYQKRYHLTITKAIIAKVLDAFLNVVVDAISNGNKIQIYGYFTIYPQHYKERTVNMFDGTSGHMSPEHYKVKINAGKKVEDACDKLMNKINEGEFEIE